MDKSDHFQKRGPSATERRLSLFLLGVLALIAAMMLLRQARFDPGAWRELPSATGEPVQRHTEAPADMDGADGLVPLSAVESYGGDTLSDKINGKADLYLGAGFRGLESRRFALAGDQSRWMERHVYDMGDLGNAFAVFSSQRRRNIQPLDLTAYAYLAGNGLFFVHGPYYVEIVAVEASPEVQAGMKALGAAFVRTHETTLNRLAELDLFPAAHRIADSIQLAARNAFGIEGADGIFTAAYAMDQAGGLAFICKRSSAAEARGLVAKFHAFWIDFGGREVAPPVDFQGARIVFILDNYEISMVQDNWVFGVHESTSLEFGLGLIEQLQHNIAGAGK